MERPQFIVELDKLRLKPCHKYLKYFVDGKADALELFRLEGTQYGWLYKYSDYDIIGFEIQQGIFDWNEYSLYVAACCPQHFDTEKFNWEIYSRYVAACCPQHFDTEKFNWKKQSCAVAQCCPQHLDKEKYNWEEDTWAVERYCPYLLHLKPQV